MKRVPEADVVFSRIPIAIDLLIIKRRWKSFLNWCLVALILFLVSCCNKAQRRSWAGVVTEPGLICRESPFRGLAQCLLRFLLTRISLSSISSPSAPKNISVPGSLPSFLQVISKAEKLCSFHAMIPLLCLSCRGLTSLCCSQRACSLCLFFLQSLAESILIRT